MSWNYQSGNSYEMMMSTIGRWLMWIMDSSSVGGGSICDRTACLHRCHSDGAADKKSATFQTNIVSFIRCTRADRHCQIGCLREQKENFSSCQSPRSIVVICRSLHINFLCYFFLIYKNVQWSLYVKSLFDKISLKSISFKECHL